MPAKLDVFGQNSIRDYITSGDSDAAKALEALKNGDPSDAQKILLEWDVIGVDDRYYRHKRAILLALSKHFFEIGKYQEAVDFITPSVRENDRDIMLFIEWAKSALEIPTLEQSAKNELTLMAKRFPDHVGLQKIYIQDVLYKGDDDAGKAALSSIRGLTPKIGGWSILWKLDPEVQKYEKRVWSKIHITGKSWGVKISPPKTAATFRIDPPPNVRLDISDIKVVSADLSTTYELTDVIEINMMTVQGNVLSADGSDNPYFVIPAPGWLSSQADVATEEVKILFKITNVGLDAYSSK